MRAQRLLPGAMLSGCVVAMGLWVGGVAAAAEPAILYLPTEPITLRPTGVAPCGSGVSSALGCGGVTGETVIEPFDGAVELALAMGDVLAPYDVRITHVRPPEYVAYVMLMPSDEPNPESQSYACTGAGINCGARQRNDLAFTFGTTMNCVDPEVTHAALHAFGRVSGLEGVDNPEDYMNYVPDYTTPPMGYMDVCSDRVRQLYLPPPRPGEQSFECTADDHFPCPDDMDGEPQQNGHQDLLLFYGARTEDADPPVLSNVLPGDGAVLEEAGQLVLDVDITDADPVVGVRWTISSPTLEQAGIEGGTLSQCTNDVCDATWADAAPLKATDSDWSFTLVGLPAGEYTITLEAADYHGNVAEMVTMVVTIGSDPGSETTDGLTSGEPPEPLDTGGGAFTTDEGGGDQEGEVGGLEGGSSSGDTDSGGGLVLDRPGCECRSRTHDPDGTLPLLLGVLGLGAVRRRR